MRYAILTKDKTDFNTEILCKTSDIQTVFVSLRRGWLLYYCRCVFTTILCRELLLLLRNFVLRLTRFSPRPFTFEAEGGGTAAKQFCGIRDNTRNSLNHLPPPAAAICTRTFFIPINSLHSRRPVYFASPPFSSIINRFYKGGGKYVIVKRARDEKKKRKIIGKKNRLGRQLSSNRDDRRRGALDRLRAQ